MQQPWQPCKRCKASFAESSGAAEDVATELRVCARILWVWLALRTAFWTLLASTQLNGTFDLMEWLAWGHQWQLGYPKHPPFPAWLAATFHSLTPGSLIGVYFLGYLTWAFTMWCVLADWARRPCSAAGPRLRAVPRRICCGPPFKAGTSATTRHCAPYGWRRCSRFSKR